MGEYGLADFSRHSLTGDTKNPFLRELKNKWLDRAWALTPFEAHVRIDFTGPVGGASAIYFSLIFQLMKWEYFVQKADEFLEVSPIHGTYYQLSHKQKEELEGRIKSGLASSSQSVADLELLLHDMRRLKEFLHYMGYQTKKEINSKYTGEDVDAIDFSIDADEKKNREREKRVDSHSLKAVFIDQVDVHTGEGISMRSIVSRWPTLITDFMRMEDKDLKPEDVMKALDVSKAEAVVLVTKNKLYQEWKKLFLGQIKDRYIRIEELVRSRKASIEAYREWLKPTVARHRLLKEGLQEEGIRNVFKTSHVWATGHAISFSVITLWVWKDFLSPEIFKGGSEEYGKKPVLPAAKKKGEITIDKWTLDNLIFGEKYGLTNSYPWITKEWCQEKLNGFHQPPGWLSRKPYYSFFEIKMEKANIRTPTGDEIEDGVFDVNMIVMSKNVMFLKLLELEAKREELNRYIDNLLGIKREMAGEVYKSEEKKDRLKYARKFTDFFGFPFKFYKGRGPYERDFDDRITKYYLAPIAAGRYGPITNFIKRKAGFGVR
ncbi:MAG: hypothetical protein QMD85_00350 [Candidatus Aenigmarchaeota archaeon]|nr:hypothetical protein [Candidatus Aenigmarchaeota archaeon]MDI6721967.1 hypothetical protein [Candidatus Aenigmarchaeota archaeon]